MKIPDLKSNRVATNLSDHELLIAKERQKKYGFKTLSDYLRHCMLGSKAPIHFIVPEVNSDLAESERATHSNLNQAIKLAHLSGIDEKRLNEIVAHISKMGRALWATRNYLYGNFDRHAAISLARMLSREDIEKILSEKNP